MDHRRAYVNKLQGELRMVFPQYLDIFSKVTTNTSLTLWETYTSPSAFMETDRQKIIHTLALQNIRTSRTGETKNPVLRDYYLKKCKLKPKLVAMGAVSHKVCNIIFAILRDNKPFEIITPQEHIKQHNAAKFFTKGKVCPFLEEKYFSFTY